MVTSVVCVNQKESSLTLSLQLVWQIAEVIIEWISGSRVVGAFAEETLVGTDPLFHVDAWHNFVPFLHRIEDGHAGIHLATSVFKGPLADQVGVVGVFRAAVAAVGASVLKQDFALGAKQVLTVGAVAGGI